MSGPSAQPRIATDHGKAYMDALHAIIRDSQKLGAALRGLVPPRAAKDRAEAKGGAEKGLSDSEGDAMA